MKEIKYQQKYVRQLVDKRIMGTADPFNRDIRWYNVCINKQRLP